MPTVAQWDELLNTANATREYITTYTKGGLKFTSTKNSNFIFLPFCGVYGDDGNAGYTHIGYYRSSAETVYELYGQNNLGSAKKSGSYRLGLLVRPVRAQ